VFLSSVAIVQVTAMIKLLMILVIRYMRQ
jgi:hypothetical protein